MNNVSSAHRNTIKLALFLLVSLAFMMVAALSFGEGFLSPVQVFHTLVEPATVQKEILLSLRLPRIFLSVLVGALLSLCGTVMQATVQNPLADPFLLGVSSGATLGMTLYLMVGAGISAAGMSLFSFAGAFCAILLVLFFSRSQQSSPVILVLTGTIINSLATALSNFLIYYSGDSEKIRKVTFWTMGSLSGANWSMVGFLFIAFLLGVLFFYSQSTTLDAFLLGTEAATTLGIHVKYYRFAYVTVISILSGILVSQCGIIGFVGLIVPHFSKLLVGSGHKKLIPISCMLGGLFLLFTDTLARTLVSGGEIPIGVITALIGSPVFLLIIKRSHYQFGGN